MKKVSEQADMEYLYGSGSIHAKYTEFIKKRDKLVEEEERAIQERLRRMREKKEQQEAEMTN